MKNTLFALLIGSLAVGAGAAESIFFQETSMERVGPDEFGEPTVVTRRSGSFSAAVDYPEFGCVQLLTSMPVELHLGGFDFTARIGDVDAVTGTAYLYYIRDESQRRIGSLTVRRNFSQLFLNATFSELPASIAAESLAEPLEGQPGIVTGPVEVSIAFATLSLVRTLHFKGRQTVAHNKIVDDDLLTITGIGSADYARPALSITSPRNGQRFETNRSELRGRASDNDAVAGVFAQIDGVDLEPAILSTNGQWSLPATLAPGTNTFSIWAVDRDGNISATNKLKVFHVVNETLRITRDAGGTVSGWTNDAPIELGRGYTFSARPDASHRFGGWSGGGGQGPVFSPEASASFIMQSGMSLHASFIPVVLELLTLEVTPGNQVTGVTNGSLLEIGRTYQATARPGPSNLFVNWTGSVQSSNLALKFVMQSNLVLQASFIPNPFLPLAGDYTGLLLETVESSGYLNFGSFTLTLTANGRFTGKLQLRGETLPFAGRADGNGASEIRVTRPLCPEPIQLQIQFDVARVLRDSVSGLLTSPTISTRLIGYRPIGDATYAGRYTFRIPNWINDEQDTASPKGDGAGTLVVDARGKATLAGNLGDGTAFTLSTVVYADGSVPIYLPLYQARGMLLGIVGLNTNVPPFHVYSSSMIWLKPFASKDRLYSGGFFTIRYFLGARYTPPPSGSNAVPWSDGILQLGEGSLNQNYSADVHLANNRVAVGASPLRPAVSLTPKTGLFSVSFRHPNTGQTTTGKGALLQFDTPYEFSPGYSISGMGAGWFIGPTATGYLLLLPLAK